MFSCDFGGTRRSPAVGRTRLGCTDAAVGCTHREPFGCLEPLLRPVSVYVLIRRSRLEMSFSRQVKHATRGPDAIARRFAETSSLQPPHMKRIRVAPGRFVTISTDLAERAVRVMASGLTRDQAFALKGTEPRHLAGPMAGRPKPLAVANRRGRVKPNSSSRRSG
jgi:hypothetical protein